MVESSKNTCASCGHQFQGWYCNLCGEKVVQREQHTLKYFLGEVIGAFTFANNKAWKTLKYLFTKPGVLPLKYIQGQRMGFISPLPLFLMINILYFLFSPLDTFNSYFSSQLNGQPYSGLIHEYGMGVMRESGLGEGAFAEKYNAHSTNISKSIILLLPIFFAFPLWALYYRRTSYLFDHLMLSISFMSFILLAVFMIMPMIITVLLSLAKWLKLPLTFDWNGGLALQLLFVAVFSYLALGLKNFYRQSIVWTVVKTLALIICFGAIMFAYRLVLFFLTIFSL